VPAGGNSIQPGIAEISVHLIVRKLRENFRKISPWTRLASESAKMI
jgi:hypothetical protein